MNKDETIADIRKEAEARFRELLEKHVDSLGHIQAMQQFNQVFDRIEAARSCEVQSLQGTIVKLNDAIAEKQELNANSKSAQIESCNGAKMREALEFLIKHKEWLRGHNLTMTLKDLEVIDRILGKAEAALAAPPRQCDVGTAAEQSRRFCAFCRPRTEPCDGCSCLEDAQHGRCEFIWAQMPYEEGGAK